MPSKVTSNKVPLKKNALKKSGDRFYLGFFLREGVPKSELLGTEYLIDGQGGGGGPLAAFLRVFVFVHSHQTGWLATRIYVRGVGGWVTRGSRAQVSVFAEESK